MTTLAFLAVVAALAVLAALALRRLFRQPLPRPADRAEAKPADARAGDVVSIAGAGEDFADLDFTVLHRNRYEVGARRWIELRGEYRGRGVRLYVWDGEQLQVALDPYARESTLTGFGFPGDDLTRDLEREGKRWRYRFSGDFVLFRDSVSEGGSFRGWLFEQDGGDEVMLIAKGEDEHYRATVARKIALADVNVFRTA